MLSPDQRFLMRGVFDLYAGSPAAEEAISKELNDYLAANRIPILGPDHARATIVVFEDYECPYCRTASQIIIEQAKSTAGVSAAFLNFPMANHPWAERAAIASICAQANSAAGFWSLQNFFYSHQDEITERNFQDLIGNSDSKALGGPLAGFDLKTCAGSASPQSRLRSDVSLARRLDVRGTPAVFVNGRRLATLTRPEQLRQILSGPGK